MKHRILYKDTLLYNGVQLISIDRSFNALYWCNRQGMTLSETIQVDSGERFEIWRNGNNKACAIPVPVKEAEK